MDTIYYHRVTNSRQGYYSKNQLFAKRSKEINIKFLTHNQYEKLGGATN